MGRLKNIINKFLDPWNKPITTRKNKEGDPEPFIHLEATKTIEHYSSRKGIKELDKIIVLEVKEIDESKLTLIERAENELKKNQKKS